MARKKHLLHVRQHLEHLQEVLEGLEKYGMVPALRHELAVLKLINQAILRQNAEKRAKGNRKDLRVEVQNGMGD